MSISYRPTLKQQDLITVKHSPNVIARKKYQKKQLRHFKEIAGIYLRAG